MIAASKDKNNRDNVRTQSAKSERDAHKLSPSKLSKRELEDLYFSLMDTNMELKRTVNLQQDNIKMLNTKVTRLMTAQRTARETSCCAPTKAIVLEQKDTISDLKRANERMSERIRILNMRLCSAKQFLKRCPSQGKCYKCCITGPSASLKNSSVSVLHSKRCESEHKASSTQVGENEPVLSRTVETETDDRDRENEQPVCKENKCRSQIEELKKKVTDLQEESSKHHADYTSRISRLEMEMAALQAENERVKQERAATQQSLQLKGQREQQLAAKLRAADAQCNEIASQWLIEKGKVAELETRAKVADMTSRAGRAVEGRQSKPVDEPARADQPTRSHFTSPPTSDYEDTPKPSAGHKKPEPKPRATRPLQRGHQGCSPSYLSLLQPAPGAASPAKSKHSDDSGYNDNPRSVDDKGAAATPSTSASSAKSKHADDSNDNPRSTLDDKALAKLNKELGKKITELQDQLDSLRIASVSLKHEQMLKSAESRAPVEISSDDSAKQENVCCKDCKHVACVREKSVGSKKKKDSYPETTTKETEAVGSPILRANEIWSRFGGEGVQQKEDKIQFLNSDNKKSSVEKRESVSSTSRQSSPSKITGKDPNKDDFSSRRRSGQDNMHDKELCSTRQSSPDKLPDKDLSSRRRSSSDKISIKDGLTTSRQTSPDKIPDKETIKDGLNVTRRTSGPYNMPGKENVKDDFSSRRRQSSDKDSIKERPSIKIREDRVSKDWIDERSMGNTERNEIVDKIEEVAIIKPPENKTFVRDKANSVKTDADDISNKQMCENFRHDVVTPGDKLVDVNKDVQTQDVFQYDHKTQEVFSSDIKRQTDFIRNVKTQDDLKRDSKTKEDLRRELQMVNKFKRDNETQGNSQRDVETQEDRFTIIRDEYNRECKRQDLLKRETDTQNDFTGGIKIRDEACKLGDYDAVCCRNKPLDIDKNAVRDFDIDQAVQHEPLQDMKKENEKKTKKIQVNSDEDSGSDNIHSPVVSTAMPSRAPPQTRRVSIAKCCVPSDDTDHEISHLSDLPPEHDGKSPRDVLSPGEQRTTTTYTDTYTEPSSDLPTLSEGEMLVASGRRLFPGEAKDEAVEAQTEAISVSQKMEEALHSIGEELARCRELLQNQRSLELQQKLTREAGTACPSHVMLRHAEATSQLAQPSNNKCTFTLHIGTLVLSDEAVIYSKDKSLLLSWKFYEQNVAMTRMRSGRIVLFDFTTEYDAEMDERFVDYLKYEEMPIVVCELNKQNCPFASCALPLRDALLNANHRVDMSLAMTMGPDMRRALSGHSADTLVTSDEVGVLDLWCMLRKRPSQTDQRSMQPTMDNRSDSEDYRMTYSMCPQPASNALNAEETKRVMKLHEVQAQQPTQLLDDSSLAKFSIRRNSLITNEVPTSIRSAGEMKQAVDRNAEQNNMQSITGLEKLEEDVLSNQQPQSISSWVRKEKEQIAIGKLVQYKIHQTTIKEPKEKNKEFKFNTPTSSYSYIDEPPELGETAAGSNTSKKSVTILPRYSKSGWEQPQPDIEKTHEQPKESIDITIQWLALNEECGAMTDPTVQRLYVAYSLMGRSGAELETPVSLPKPKSYIEKCVFNFKKTIQVRECDVPLLGHMGRCKSNDATKYDPKDCIVFNVISEPAEDPLGLASCEDIGYAYLYLGDVLSYSAGSDTYTEVIAVRSALREDVVCGVLSVQVDGLEVVRKAKLSASFKY